MVDTTTFEAGYELDDRVTIIEMIGRGAMGCVYKATQQNVDRPVAVKALHLSCLSDKESVARFFREAKLVSSLNHPNIVRVFAVGMAKDVQPYFVMDYVQGETLADFIEHDKLTAKQFLSVFMQVASALEHAHSKGVIHRDIKPRNIILVDDNGELTVKLVDFGIARTVVPDTSEKQKITRTGAIIGSPTYMSPEQCTGRKVDHRTDIYSLGCVMYEAATGDVPFKDEDAVGLIGKHVFEAPDPVARRARIPDLPNGVFQIISTAMEKLPESRYQSADGVYRDLESVSDRRAPSVAATITETAKAQVRPIWKNPVVVACVVVALLGAGGFYYMRTEEIRTAETNETLIKAAELCERAVHLAHFRKMPIKALELYGRAYALYKQKGIRDKRLADVCMGSGLCEAQMDNFDAANKWYAESVQIRQEVDPDNISAICDTNREWARSLMSQHNYGEAVNHLLVAYDGYKQKPPAEFTMIRTQHYLIESLIRTKQFSTALTVYPELIKVQKRYGAAPDLLAETYLDYAKLLEKTEHNDEAAEQRRIAADLQKEASVQEN